MASPASSAELWTAWPRPPSYGQRGLVRRALDMVAGGILRRELVSRRGPWRRAGGGGQFSPELAVQHQLDEGPPGFRATAGTAATRSAGCGRLLSVRLHRGGCLDAALFLLRLMSHELRLASRRFNGAAAARKRNRGKL
jgi:hypothetical protein